MYHRFSEGGVAQMLYSTIRNVVVLCACLVVVWAVTNYYGIETKEIVAYAIVIFAISLCIVGSAIINKKKHPWNIFTQ